MSAVQPYDAWFFFAADSVDEVDQEYRKLGTDEEGWQRWPSADDLVVTVRVIAVEQDHGDAWVWFLRDGQAERRPSWTVRAADIRKLAEGPVPA